MRTTPAEGGGFEPPVREPVRQFSKLLVSATHPSFQMHSLTLTVGLSLKRGAKVLLFFDTAKLFGNFFWEKCKLVGFESNNTADLLVQIVGVAEFNPVDGIGDSCHIEHTAIIAQCIFDGLHVASDSIGIDTHKIDDGVVKHFSRIKLLYLDRTACRRFCDILIDKFLNNSFRLMLLPTRGEQQQGDA